MLTLSMRANMESSPLPLPPPPPLSTLNSGAPSSSLSLRCGPVAWPLLPLAAAAAGPPRPSAVLRRHHTQLDVHPKHICMVLRQKHILMDTSC